MSDRATDSGELLSSDYTYTPQKGFHAEIIIDCVLNCVDLKTNAYVGVAFQRGEKHKFDLMEWQNKDGSRCHGFVLRTGKGDAYLMPHLFDRYCKAKEDEAP